MKVTSIGLAAEGVLVISTSLEVVEVVEVAIHAAAQALVIVAVKTEYTNMAKKRPNRNLLLLGL